MMKKLIVLLLICSLYCAFGKLAQAKKTFSLAEARDLCNDMKKSRSVFNSMRCLEDGEDLARHGKAYKAQHPEIKDASLNPIVLLPGFGGSGLEAKLDKPDSPAWYCFKKFDWFRIWLALEELFVQDCWMDNLVLTYHTNNNSYSNTYGVEIRGIDFGGVSGIDYMDYVLGFPIPFTSVYATIIQSLVEVGYQPGVNLRGVPYDFRLPPDAENNGLYDNMKSLIEQTYTSNGNMPVHVITHSFGGPLFLYFLNQMGSAWADQYIKSFIPIAGPWAGSPKALRTLISGDNFGLEFLGFSLADKLKFRTVGRTAGGLVMLIPDPDFWEDQIFVYTENKNYTADDLRQLFVDIGASTTAIIYDDVGRIIPEMKPPGVPTYCLYGTNEATEFFYHYPTNNFNADPTIIDTSDLGDGTVPLRSLQECNSWTDLQSEPVVIKEFDTRDHTDILEDPDLVTLILDIVTNSS